MKNNKDHLKKKNVLVTSDQGNVFFCFVPQTEKLRNIILRAKKEIEKKNGGKNITLHNIRYYLNESVDNFLNEKFAHLGANELTGQVRVPKDYFIAKNYSIK